MVRSRPGKIVPSSSSGVEREKSLRIERRAGRSKSKIGIPKTSFEAKAKVRIRSSSRTSSRSARNDPICRDDDLFAPMSVETVSPHYPCITISPARVQWHSASSARHGRRNPRSASQPRRKSAPCSSATHSRKVSPWRMCVALEAWRRLSPRVVMQKLRADSDAVPCRTKAVACQGVRPGRTDG